MAMRQGHSGSGESDGGGVVAVLDADSARAARLAAALERLGVDAIAPDDPRRYVARLSDEQPEVVVVSAGDVADLAFEQVAHIELAPPIILIHGPSEIPTVVEAMRRGAFDYLTRPADPGEIHDRVREAIAASRRRRELLERRVAAEERVATLDSRMRLLAEQIMLGHSNNEIARLWGVSERTIASHRASLMRTAGAVNTAHLVRILIEGGMAPSRAETESTRSSNGKR